MLADMLFSRLPPNIFITREQFISNLEGWDVEPIEIAGRVAFITMTKGPEFHFTSFETGHRIPLAVIRERLGRIIAIHGYATTKAPKEDIKQHRINVLFGCTVTGEDEYDRHYRIERLHHA